MSAVHSKAGVCRAPIGMLPTRLGVIMTAPAKTVRSTRVRRPDSARTGFDGRNSATAGVQPVRSQALSGEARQEWVSQASCRDRDPDELFVKGAAQRKAAAICRHCPVLLQCRADALDNRVEFGVWGGMTERQRRALLRQYPDVESWADFYAKQVERSSTRAKARERA